MFKQIISQLRNSLSKRDYLEQSNLQLWYFPSIAEYSTELESAGFRAVMAQHFDRPTDLADENSGIKDWISMFGKIFFKDIEEKYAEEIKNEVQEMIKKNGLPTIKEFE